MARNIEIKGRIESVQTLAPRVAKIANKGPTEIFQDDTFFQCETGRLKLRAFSESHANSFSTGGEIRPGRKNRFTFARKQQSQPHCARRGWGGCWGRFQKAKR